MIMPSTLPFADYYDRAAQVAAGTDAQRAGGSGGDSGDNEFVPTINPETGLPSNVTIVQPRPSRAGAWGG